MSTRVSDVMSARTANVLLYGGILTIEDAAKTGAPALLQLPNFGKSAMREVEKAMANLGLFFPSSKWGRENPTYASLKNYLILIAAEQAAAQAKLNAAEEKNRRLSRLAADMLFYGEQIGMEKDSSVRLTMRAEAIQRIKNGE